MLERGADLALDDDPANRYLPWIVALMVYLAALALAGAMVLGSSAGRWQSGHSDRMTVPVPPVQSRTLTIETACQNIPSLTTGRKEKPGLPGFFVYRFQGASP